MAEHPPSPSLCSPSPLIRTRVGGCTLPRHMWDQRRCRVGSERPALAGRRSEPGCCLCRADTVALLPQGSWGFLEVLSPGPDSYVATERNAARKGFFLSTEERRDSHLISCHCGFRLCIFLQLNERKNTKRKRRDLARSE